MPLFRRRPPASPEGQDEARSFVLPGGMYAPSNIAGFGSTAGVAVTNKTALQNPAVWACQRILVSTISMLPVHAYRSIGGRLQQLPTDPALVRNPSGKVSRRAWVAQAIRAGVMSGNIYGKVVAVDGRGVPTQIETVHPDDVTWRRDPNDNTEVPFLKGKRQEVWPLGDFWHVPISQFMIPGSVQAMSPTEYARTSIGTGIAAEDFGARFFGDGGHPTMVAKVSSDINYEQATALKQALLNSTRGNREPAVVGSDVELQPWQASPKDSDFIDLLRFEVEQACRVYGVPPSMVYAAVSGQAVTYANVSQADLSYLKYSVQAWVADLEDAWSDLVALPHSIRFNTDALLRMDALARAELHKLRLETKTRTVNEVRIIEDEEPFTDPIFDEPGVPGTPADITKLPSVAPAPNV